MAYFYQAFGAEWRLIVQYHLDTTYMVLISVSLRQGGDGREWLQGWLLGSETPRFEFLQLWARHFSPLNLGFHV